MKLDAAARNRQVVMFVLAAIFCMGALSFASVPLYRLFCGVTGLAGQGRRADGPAAQVLERTMTIRFSARVSPELDWRFAPTEPRRTLHVGETGLTAFTAENLTGEASAGTAIYSITPEKAAPYFIKVQCFCFSAQTLTPGQKVEMPVVFYVDPAIADDPDLDDVTQITLSYSFLPAGSGPADDTSKS